MTAIETFWTNAFQTTVAAELDATSNVLEVDSAAGLQAPCYLVLDPTSTQREYVRVIGISGDVLTVVRYLEGSAQLSGLVHAVGTVVRASAVAQGYRDLHDRVNAMELVIDDLEARILVLEGSATSPRTAFPGTPGGAAALPTPTVDVAGPTSWPPSGFTLISSESEINNASAGAKLAATQDLVLNQATLNVADNVELRGHPDGWLVLDGQNAIQQAIIGSATGAIFRNMEIRNYGTLVTESFNNVGKSDGSHPYAGNEAARAIFCRDMTNVTFTDIWAHDNDSAFQVGNGFTGRRILTEWNKHRAWYSFGTGDNSVFEDITLRSNNVSRVDGHHYYWRHLDAVCKFIGMDGCVINGWEATDNGSAGLWWDSGCTNVEAYDVLSLRNAQNGIRWEINSGTIVVDGFECRDNADNFAIANCAGQATFRNGIVSGRHSLHPASSHARLVDDPTRSPRLSDVLIENVVFDEAPAVFALENPAGNTPPNIVLTNVTNANGSPVTLS